MIELDRFIDDAKNVIGRDISSNKEQNEVVRSPMERCLKIVAGPGSGKTTVIVLRLLKMIYVDDVPPKSIIATTFTRKAAKELKSRILSWGHKLQYHYVYDSNLPSEIRKRIGRLNFDLVNTGTLDSIAEDTLTMYRQPDENPPMIITEFVSRQLMLYSLFKSKKEKDAIKGELQNLGINPYNYRSTSAIVKVLLDIYYRAVENMIDVRDIANEAPAVAIPIEDYAETLAERQFMDFPALESKFMEYLKDSRSSTFTDDIKVLMVDEYQDTNLQQEAIYKILGDKIVSNGGSITVVGDDDQSIYRFRGSRVHLFANLEERFEDTSIDFETLFLSVNYRSTPDIVEFYNDYINLDDEYQNVRVRNKPPMTVGRRCDDSIPILGIFRDTEQELAQNIVDMVNQYVLEGRYVFHCTDGSEYVLERGDNGGANDFVLLMNSTKYKNYNGKLRLPTFIKQDFEASESGISDFNPRGNNLYDDQYVMILCGTLLNCIDPDSTYQNQCKISKDVTGIIQRWRAVAETYIEKAPEINGNRMRDLVDSWKNRTPFPKGNRWNKPDVSLLDMTFQILTWIPELRNDAEELVYLQALCEAISSTVLIKNREINLVFEKGKSEPKAAAVKDIFYKIFIPIADGTMDIDEDLFFSVTMKDRFNIMTIHQSKGLEFPITIVDVSSEFQMDSGKIKRYPDKMDQTSVIEGIMRHHSDDIPMDRDLLDTQFDDIIRKSFVAYSRAQDVLILIGSNRTLLKKNPLKHMGLGWDRHENWIWKGLPNIKMMRRWNEDYNQERTIRHPQIQSYRGFAVIPRVRSPISLQQQGFHAAVGSGPALVRRIHTWCDGGGVPSMEGGAVRYRSDNLRGRPVDIRQSS